MRLRPGPKEAYFWRKHLQPYLAANGFINIRLAANGIGETDCMAYKHPWYFGIELKRIATDNPDTAFRQMQAGLSKAQQLRVLRVVKTGAIHVTMAQGRKGWLYASVTEENPFMGLTRRDLSIHGATTAEALHKFFKIFTYRGDL